MAKADDINNRFIKAFKKLESDGTIISKTDASTKLGCSPQVLTETLKGRMNATTPLLQNFFKNYNVNPNYVFLGRLPIINGDKKSIETVDEDQAEYIKTKKGLPLIPIDAMAGIGTGDKTALLLDCEHYYIPEFQQKADFLIRITGTSMSPKYYNGDVVACKTIPVKTFIQWGKVYVMDTVQGALCKRLFESEKGETHIRVVSDNDKYPPFEMHRDEIRALAIVIGVIRLE
jgi:phage repressor protein C with HTH and peptisase S24 domain